MRQRTTIVMAFMSVLSLASAAAWTDTVNLVCHLNNGPGFSEDSPTDIELNQSQSFVAIQFGTQHDASGRNTPYGVSFGPVSAQFGNDTIASSDESRANSILLNRVTET